MKTMTPTIDRVSEAQKSEPVRTFIPFHLSSIGEEEIAEVVATLRSGWLTTGPKTKRFEELFAEYVGAPHALALNSGTAGMHVALLGLDVGPGDEVITTPLTFCSTVNTILQVGAKPVLADVGPDGNIDPAEIARKLTPRTRAIIPVHLAGLACDMNAIWEIASRRGLYVIEDAAHATGTRHLGRAIGWAGSGQPSNRSSSDAVVFSFYATKGMTTGEGGMVTTSNAKLAATMRILSLHGISKDAWKRYTADGSWFYEVVACGFKYNLTDIQASLGIHQLARVEDFIETKTRYVALYNEVFGNIPELETAPEAPSRCRHSWHLYVLRLNLDMLNIDRDTFIRELHAARVGTSVHFIPISMHPYYAENESMSCENYPRAMELYRRSISLPIYPAMSEEQVRYVASAVAKVAHKYAKRRVIGARGA